MKLDLTKLKASVKRVGSQAHVARLARIGHRTLEDWLHGRRSPRFLDFYRLCRVLDAEPGEFVISWNWELRWNLPELTEQSRLACDSVQDRADEAGLDTRILCVSDPDAEPFEWDCPDATAQMIERWLEEEMSGS